MTKAHSRCQIKLSVRHNGSNTLLRGRGGILEKRQSKISLAGQLNFFFRQTCINKVVWQEERNLRNVGYYLNLLLIRK